MPKDPRSYLTQATEHLDQGEPEKSDALLVRFMKEVPKEKRDPKLMMDYHILAARLMTRKTEHLEAVQQCMEALRLAQQTGDPGALAGTLRWLGHIHWRKGDYHLALEYLEQALAKVKEAGIPSLEGSILIELGNCHCNLAEVDKARESYRNAITLFETSGASRELSRALNNLADTYLQQKDYRTAIGLFEKSKNSAGKDINMRAWASMNLSECLSQTDRLEDAKKELDEAVTLMKRSGDRFGTSMAYTMMGVILWKMGKWDAGEEHLIAARNIAHEVVMPVHEATIVRDMGIMFMRKGEKDTARRLLEEARAVFREHDSRIRLAEVENDLKVLDGKA